MGINIKWNKRAVNQFDDAIEYIRNDSPANGEKVKKEILLKIDSLQQFPEKFNPDKYKTENDGSFRAFEFTITGFLIVTKEMKSGSSEQDILKRTRRDIHQVRGCRHLPEVVYVENEVDDQWLLK